MIKSFLKKVFSSSTENNPAAKEELRSVKTEEEPEQAAEFEQLDNPLAGNEISFETATITKEWLDKQKLDVLELTIERLYQDALKGGTPIKRLRLGLEPSLEVSADSYLGKKLGKFLDYSEQQMIDLTFFLDKHDESTMRIYKTYLLPEGIDKLNSFLQERCMMISETSEGLAQDYRREMEDYLSALNISLTPEFFAEFEQWREEVLKIHHEEIAVTEMKAAPSESTVMIKISKEEVENENIQQIDQYMREALKSPEEARARRGTLLFSFYGYAHENLLDLMNKKEINEWASLLVERHPYIFYFLNDEEYPMSLFLTSLVVATEVEDEAVYYNEEQLSDFQQYIGDALRKITHWLGEEEEETLDRFASHFQSKGDKIEYP